MDNGKGYRILMHYGTLPFALLAGALFAADRYLSAYLTTNRPINLDVSQPLLTVALHIFLILIWALSYRNYLRSIIYKDKTGGRSYHYDRKSYKRSYRELVAYFKDADPHIFNTLTFAKQPWKDAEGIILGITDDGRTVNLPSNKEGNLAVFGSPGSRKTTGIAIPSCSRYKGSVLAVDIKGDIYNYTHKFRRILRFCPDLRDENGASTALEHSCSYDPFDGVAKMDETEIKLYLSNMALTLIPDEGGSEGSYFPSRARKLLVGITAYLIHSKPDITFPEVLHAILHGMQPTGIQADAFPNDVFAWITTIMDSGYLPAVEQVGSMYGNNERNISGCWDALCGALTPFSNQVLDVLLSGKGDCISAKALDEGYDVYLQISQSNLDVYAPLFTMILSSLMSSLTQRTDASCGVCNRPILVMLDEFPQLTFSYSMISSALATLRSKSVQCMLLSQSVAQLSYKYQHDGWRSLLGNCQFQLILKSNEELTQKHFSALFGSLRVLKISNSEQGSTASGRTIQEAIEPVYQPEYFGDLTDKLLIYYDGKRLEAKKIKCYE